ncbi:MAG: hypothetical protein A3F40_00820 [Chlamydiae bacterium RIFCSPHIGHO2_12_FULL_27_8]|nr:MAG: hypothetical protein A3F40_00820 [Chlamydiae bacterium RIFCSPHIGHO2_12_FULL_27_8]OGN66666.1 MAG: hypothetical protein A2888_02275 [Chlamydiae bacterium RIFCSPLOWO2_01_FULL_28_7]
MPRIILFLFLFLFTNVFSKPAIDLGVDVFFSENRSESLKNKKIALIINHTSVNKYLKPTIDVFLENEKDYQVIKLFSPEHGITGSNLAGEKVKNNKLKNLQVFSLHGKTRRPTEEMLKDVDVLIYDIQDIGSRSYTYAATLYYAMEEAAKKNIKVIVFDRPNPINGIIVDGPMLDKNYKSFVGYINVPYCHGMTIGELAIFFNKEENVKCNLEVIKMKNWTRDMSFSDTGLHWIPTSPYIPEIDSAIFYPSTGILGELNLVNIGIGYTLPFKIIGAPWIDADNFAKHLNSQKLQGVKFIPFHFRPFYGQYKGEDCNGVKIIVTNMLKYRPLAVQYLLIGLLKSLYPDKVKEKLAKQSDSKIRMFCLVNGNKEILELLKNEKFAAWKMIQFDEEKVKEFRSVRQKYLLY